MKCVLEMSVVCVSRIANLGDFSIGVTASKCHAHCIKVTLLPQGILGMIRDGDFADHGIVQKATRETFKRYGFLKRALVLIG
jgi:hypothetical protein